MSDMRRSHTSSTRISQHTLIPATQCWSFALEGPLYTCNAIAQNRYPSSFRTMHVHNDQYTGNMLPATLNS